jgi:hypothetical protein
MELYNWHCFTSLSMDCSDDRQGISPSPGCIELWLRKPGRLQFWFPPTHLVRHNVVDRNGQSVVRYCIYFWNHCEWCNVLQLESDCDMKTVGTMNCLLSTAVGCCPCSVLTVRDGRRRVPVYVNKVASRENGQSGLTFPYI